MRILLIFNGLGVNNNYQSNIRIYDGNNIVFEGNTYNGKIYVDLMPNRLYKVEASFFSTIFIASIYTNRCKYVFSFNHAIYGTTVTLSLRDYYYNLPIEKGVIILWQRQ